MTGSPDFIPATRLRHSFQRALDLPLEAQIEECADHLQHPEILDHEIHEALAAIASCFDSGSPDRADDEPGCDEHGPREPGDFFYPTRDLFVVGASRAFTCLATDFDPLRPFREAEETLAAELDYVGITCDVATAPVLGAVERPDRPSPYPLLLSLIACLTEMAPASQIERLNRSTFKGILSQPPGFDLNLVLFDGSEEESEALTPICQLTRDLAENAKTTFQRVGDGLLRDIVCLRMNPRRFDGRLRFVWRV